MRLAGMLAAIIAIIALGACASGPDVEIHPVDTSVIGTYSSFEIIPDRRDIPLGPMRTRQARVQIEKALADEMQQLGYRHLASGADIQIEYVTYITEEYREYHDERYTIAGAVIDRHLPESRDVALRIGTLHVHLLHDGQALYEGIASGLVEGEVTMERIRIAVKALLREVPAGPMMDPDAARQRRED